MLPLDSALFHLLNASPSAPAGWILAARWASDWLPVVCGLVLAFAGLTQGPAWRRTLLLTLASMGCAWLACRLVRWGLPAPRPIQLGMGTQWIAHSGGSSFPSMHATGAFAWAVSLCWAATRRGASHRMAWLPPLACTLAATVALSRVVLGVHFPTDILAGLAVGGLSATLVWKLALRWDRWHLAAPHSALPATPLA